MAKWTPARLNQLIPHLMEAAHYNHAYYSLTPQRLANWLADAEPSTLFLGDFEGFVAFYPIVPGLGAEAHHFIWSPRFMRRPQLGRATLRWACRQWDLKRITAQCPARHRRVQRACEAMGFTLEGRLRHGVVDDRGITDMLIYGILAEELKED